MVLEYRKRKMTEKTKSVLKSSQLDVLETDCNLILEYKGVKFVGVINFLGNLIAGGFKKGITSMGNENTRHMMYMQLKLDLAMRQDYDKLFGPVDYVKSRRAKFTKVSMPVNKYMILLITKNGINCESIIKKTSTVFKSSLGGF